MNISDRIIIIAAGLGFLAGIFFLAGMAGSILLAAGG